MAKPTFRVWVVAALLALVTIALYWPVTGYDFVNYDDPDYVTANTHVQCGLTWENLGWALTTLDIGLWHPLTLFSHMLDCQLYGLKPGGHHLTSLLLHAGNTVLLLVVLRRMTGALWRSAVVAALFALHPLHVESVAWVAERKDVLSTYFVLLTLWAYARHAKNAECRMQNAECGEQQPAPNTHHAPRTTHHVSRFTFHASAFYLLSLLFFALGLMSKPMVVTLPLLLLLLDYWPLRRMQNATPAASRFTFHVSRFTFHVPLPLLLEKLPFALMAALTCSITLLAAKGVGSLPSAARCPMAARVANVTLSYARYFWEAFWPSHLAVYYPLPASFSGWAVAGAAFLLLGISAAAISLAGRRPYVLVGWLWYLVTLLPVIGLIQLGGYSHADRYTYMPFIGVFLALTWGSYELVRGKEEGRRKNEECRSPKDEGATMKELHNSSFILHPSPLWVAGGTAIVLCLLLTRHQLAYWKDSEALFRHALAVTENNALAHNDLGNAFQEKGQWDEAIRQFQETTRLTPYNADAHYNLGNALAGKGQMDAAIRQFREALRLKPDYAEVYYSLGMAFMTKSQADEAIRQFQEAFRLKPDYAEAHDELGKIFDRQGRLDEAINQYKEAVRLKPDYAEAHYSLGNALGRKGQIDQAISQFQDALHLKPDYAEACHNLGNALLMKGQVDEAIRQLQKAVRLRPDHADAHNNLGNALLGKGQTDEAILQFQEAIRLKPNHAEAHYNLGNALTSKGQTDEAITQYREAVRLKPDYAKARNNLGIALARRGQMDEAIAQFQEALRFKPDFAEARKNLDMVVATKAHPPGQPGASTNQ